ncbi:hypothetical protein YC2023_048937 [Brassica napus]
MEERDQKCFVKKVLSQGGKRLHYSRHILDGLNYQAQYNSYQEIELINEEKCEGLMDDLGGVNLSKFVSEAVAKLKSSDIQAAAQFSPSLTQGLLKVFLLGISADKLLCRQKLKGNEKNALP